MVIGNEFVWLHMGKTGGDSTKEMFDCLAGILFADHKSQKEKHFVMNRTDINPELLKNKKISIFMRTISPIYAGRGFQVMRLSKCPNR